MAGILSIKIRADATPFERSLKTIGRNITAFSQKSLAVGRGISLGFTAPLMAIGATAVNAAADFDSLERALSGIMGGANAAAGEMVKLKEAAKLPGLGFEEAVRGSVNLQAVGLTAEEARKTLIGFGTAIAASGGGAENLASVTKQLTQMISKNRILQEDFGILQENVPLIGDALEKAFGTRNIEKVRATGIAAEDFNMRLVGALQTLPAVIAATGGLRNNLDNFKDSLKFAQVELGKAILKNIDLEGVLQSVTQTIEDFLTVWGEMSEGTQKLIVASAKYVAIGGALAWIIGQIGSAVGTLTMAFGGLIRFMATYDKITGIIKITTGGWITIVLAAAAAIGLFAYNIYQANKPIDDLSGYLSSSAKAMQKEMTQLQFNFKLINDTNTSNSLRLKLINEIKNKYGQYLPDLKTEQDYLNNITKVMTVLNTELTKKFNIMRLQGVADKQLERSIQLLDKERTLNEDLQKVREKTRKQEKGGGVFNTIGAITGSRQIGKIYNELEKVKKESVIIEEAWKKTSKELEDLIGVVPVLNQELFGDTESGGGIGKLKTQFELLEEELKKTEDKYKNVVLTQGALSADAIKLEARYYELLNTLQGVNREWDKIENREFDIKPLPQSNAPKTEQENFGEVFSSDIIKKIQSSTGYINDQSKAMRELGKSTSEVSEIVQVTQNNAFKDNLTRKFDKVRNSIKITVEDLKDLNESIKQVFDEMLGNMAINLGEELGKALAGAGFSIRSVLMPVADALIQFGKLAIQAGVAALGIKEALTKLGGVGAIAAGVALVALGTFVKSKLAPPKLAKGGLAFGPTMAVVGDNRGASYDPEVIAPLSKLKGMLGDTGFNGVLETRISGNDLIILLNRSQKGLNRIK
jgi:tape measure domain-containing protein